jgi:hypothetical protein
VLAKGIWANANPTVSKVGHKTACMSHGLSLLVNQLKAGNPESLSLFSNKLEEV